MSERACNCGALAQDGRICQACRDATHGDKAPEVEEDWTANLVSNGNGGFVQMPTPAPPGPGLVERVADTIDKLDETESILSATLCARAAIEETILFLEEMGEHQAASVLRSQLDATEEGGS